MIKIFPKTELKIVKLYVVEELSAREIVDKLELDVTTRTVQRILKDHGVSRSVGDAFRLAVSRGKVKYYRKPEHLKKKRKHISIKQRFKLLQAANFKCKYCGRSPDDGIRLEVDHVDGDPSNHSKENRQVMCNECNQGKFLSS